MSDALASARDASPRSRTTSTRSATPFAAAVASAEATAAGGLVARDDRERRDAAAPATSAMTPVPHAKSITSPSPLDASPNRAARAGTGCRCRSTCPRSATERADRQRRGQPRQLVLLRPRLRVVPGERIAGRRARATSAARASRRARANERRSTSFIAERHVLDPSAGEDDDLGVGVRGDEAPRCRQRVQRSRQPQQHDPCAARRAQDRERQRPERARQAEARARSPREPARRRADPDARGCRWLRHPRRRASARRTQSPMTTSVPRGVPPRVRGGLVEDQPVGGIDGEAAPAASRSGQRRRASGE